MFLPSPPGQDQAYPDPDPALLAFVKCHVTSLARWEVLRVLATHDGAWVRAEALARATHRHLAEVVQTLDDLTADGIVEAIHPAAAPEDVSYRLPADEPTSVVLRRLIDSATHSQELRAIIAAHLQHLRQAGSLRRSTAAA
jgi:DNA-binding HxlR family transcriptional regulator